MPTKRKSSKSSSGTSAQVRQLRATIKQLRTRLERESRARKFEARVVADTRKARAQVLKQMDALRQQGRKLATQLKGALTDAGRREQARKDALAKIAELRAEVARRGEEVRRKSIELKNLAVESAERARAIIASDAPGASAAPPTEQPPSSSGEGGESSDPEKKWP
jgi:chromosome segregation ATPase